VTGNSVAHTHPNNSLSSASYILITHVFGLLICRRRKVLVRGFILIGIAIFVKKQFFGASQEDKAVSDST